MRAETLDFVDELKRDISSYLLERPALSKDELVDRLTCAGVLCYRRPADAEEDRWAAARAAGGAAGAPRPRPPPEPGGGGSGGSGAPAGPAPAGPAPAGPAPARPAPALALFGAPPASSQVRWPPRPREDEAFGERACSSASRLDCGERLEESDGEAEESEASDSADSEGGWEPGQSRRGSEDRPRSRQAAAPVTEAEGAREAEAAPPRSVDVNELLEFTSCFESGNLRYVVYSVEDEAYDLVLENDVNTRGHTQWFYFAVRNGRPGTTVRLRIINMSKAKSLFRLGMRPMAWSEARAAQLASELLAAQRAARGGGGSSGSTSRPVAEAERMWSGASSQLWAPAGERVRYHRTRADRHGTSSGSYTLAFEYTFEEGAQRSDCVYFAMAVPFTYSMLSSSIAAVASDPTARQWCRTKCLCSTLGSLRCELLEVSNWAVSKRQKKSVVVSSRVHPGESNASWVMHGLLGFLLSPCPEAKVLRDHFVWQIVPMMNPDGVVCGNYRCALCGVDLNRQWRRPNETLHGSVHGLKRLVARAKRKRGLCMYIDLHGHSRKLGVFSYACGQYPKDDYRRFTVRMYPKLLGMLTPEFSAPSCRWRVGKGKRGTGRVVVAKDLGLTETYTIEASFFGHMPQREGCGEGEGKERCTPAEGAEEGAGESAARPPSASEEAQLGLDVVRFTPAKLEVFGANLARAILLHQNLHMQLKQAVQRHGGKPADPWPDIGTPGEGRPDAGAWTPSTSSEAEDERSDSDAAEAVEEAQEPAPEEPAPAAEEDGCLERCLGIDVGGVLQDLQSAPLSDAAESDSFGSDSSPSGDNLGEEELSHIGRWLKIRQKPLCKKSGAPHSGHAGADSKQKRRRSAGHRREERGERRRRGAAAREPPRPAPRAESRRIVAFGQTTYYQPELAARSASLQPGPGSEPSPPNRRPPGRRPSLGSPAHGGLDLSIGGLSLSTCLPAERPAPALPQAPAVRRDAAEQPLLVLSPPRDRFAFPRAAGAATAGASQAEGRRRREAGSQLGEDLPVSLTRRLHMRNVSSSLLQFGRRPGPEAAASTLPGAFLGDDRAAAAAGTAFGSERPVHAGCRMSRPVSRQSPRMPTGLPRANSQREEASLVAHLRRGSEAWGPNTPRDGCGSARPQQPRTPSTSMPPALARERLSPQSHCALRQELLTRRR